MQDWPASPHPSLCDDSEDSVLIRAVMVRWYVTCQINTIVIYADARRIVCELPSFISLCSRYDSKTSIEGFL